MAGAEGLEAGLEGGGRIGTGEDLAGCRRPRPGGRETGEPLGCLDGVGLAGQPEGQRKEPGEREPAVAGVAQGRAGNRAREVTGARPGCGIRPSTARRVSASGPTPSGCSASGRERLDSLRRRVREASKEVATDAAPGRFDGAGHGVGCDRGVGCRSAGLQELDSGRGCKRMGGGRHAAPGEDGRARLEGRMAGPIPARVGWQGKAASPARGGRRP